MTATDTINREPLQGLRRHKLMTAEIRRALPALGATDGQGIDAVALVKFFCPWTGDVYYVTEFDGEDVIYSYMVCPSGRSEWGYQSLSALAVQMVLSGVPAIERDCHWAPRLVSDCDGVEL